jgi:hypothetical protein
VQYFANNIAMVTGILQPFCYIMSATNTTCVNVSIASLLLEPFNVVLLLLKQAGHIMFNG